MSIHRLIATPLNLWRCWEDVTRKIRSMRQRREVIGNIRNARGITLLREWLSPEQQAQFDAHRHFDVIGCDTGTRYRIRHGAAPNVHEIDAAGRSVVGWCFAPSGPLVAGDVMLAQKIALETNERAALAIANRFPIGDRI